MIYKISNYNVVIIFILATTSLFVIKNNASNTSYQLNEVDKQILKEKNNIYMLKAEIAYLTSPVRLRKLSNDYLHLQNIKPHQMIKDPLTNNVEDQQYVKYDASLAPKLIKHNVKWRYKRSSNNYVKTISSQK
ncbi:MAG: hypothetical protein EOP33_00600 [Rickettsiaceae bacterium]|nr:MAG: hypothetical protein EOP33_00600 [Rickettsiaceae bacterium]